MELKFYICENCGNIAMKVKDQGDTACMLRPEDEGAHSRHNRRSSGKACSGIYRRGEPCEGECGFCGSSDASGALH